MNLLNNKYLQATMMLSLISYSNCNIIIVVKNMYYINIINHNI